MENKEEETFKLSSMILREEELRNTKTRAKQENKRTTLIHLPKVKKIKILKLKI